MSKNNIVPSTFPDENTATRLYFFCVPDLPEWRELFIGNILQMTYGYFWDKSTGDFNEARNIMSNMVFNGLSNSSGDCICDIVADCIVNSQTVKDALDKQTSSDGTGNNSQNLTAGIDTNNCNNDNLFGATLELVNELNNYATDAFEIIEASTNFVELIAEMLGSVPVAGDILALIPNLLNFFQEIGAETYSASYTSTLRDEIACDLFCIYQENCTLSLDDVFSYMWGEFSQSAEPQSVTEAIDAFTAIGVVVGRVTVFGVFMIALSFLKLGDGNLPSIPFVALPSTNRLRIALAVGASQPNSSWNVLCDPCGNTWIQNFYSGGGDVTVPYTAVYESNNLSCINTYNAIDDRLEGCTNGTVTAVGIDMVIPVNITNGTVEVTMTYNKTRVGPSPDTLELLIDGIVVDTASVTGSGVGSRTMIATLQPSITSVTIRGAIRNNSSSDGSYLRITNLNFTGEGVNPF